MKIGLYMATQWREGADLGAETANLLEQTRAARDNGFGSLMVGQHFLSRPLQMFAATPLLSRLAAESGDMLLGPALLLLPMLDPVIVAEEAATLDWLCGGNHVVALGLGYRHEEFDSLGVPFKERVPRFLEKLEVVRKLWTGEPVTHHGRFHKLDGVRASLKPKRPGGPPVWIGGDVAAAAKRAGQIGDAWIVSPMLPFREAAALMKLFRDTRAAAGKPPATINPMIRECYVGKLDDVREPLLFKYQAYAAWGQNEQGSVKTDRLAREFDRFCAERFIIGDEAQVLDGIQRTAAECGVDHILMRVQWPGLGQKQALQTIDRLGKVVARLKS